MGVILGCTQAHPAHPVAPPMVDLSNHQSVCLVCPPLITLNRLVEFHEIWYGANAVHGDIDSMIFNPIASII
jgi:hypothetical protein